jgi:hypothetical protein
MICSDSDVAEKSEASASRLGMWQLQQAYRAGPRYNQGLIPVRVQGHCGERPIFPLKDQKANLSARICPQDIGFQPAYIDSRMI